MESYQHVLDTLRSIIESSVDDLDGGEINADGNLKGELGIDSLGMFEVADKVQERWGIVVTDEDISTFTTVDSIVTFIQVEVGKKGIPAVAEA
ncbi:acyl carrier protein [Catenulispora sp. GAS73]|uniref:acyl carrier protein n=1 Tax=Catenulispora sp. GAS73 TaxID=3156269 RepID=UPI0035169477